MSKLNDFFQKETSLIELAEKGVFHAAKRNEIILQYYRHSLLKYGRVLVALEETADKFGLSISGLRKILHAQNKIKGKQKRIY